MRTVGRGRRQGEARPLRTVGAALGVTAALLVAGMSPPPATAQEPGTHLLTVVGLGGDPAYAQEFLEWGLQIRTAAVDRYAFPEDRVTLLGEDPEVDPAISGRSDREGVEAAVNRIAREAGASDPVLIVLIGHGSFRGDEARFNLPGPDLTASEWSILLDGLGDRPVAVVNTASASGPFTAALAGDNRTVITATKTGGERNETQFPRYFAEALSGEAADLDKDGTLSLLEAFTYTRAEVARHYEQENLLLTEHAVLEDDGDGEGSEEPSLDGPDGSAAARFRLATATGARTARAQETSGDTTLVRLMDERAELEERVARLRALREQMDPEEYDRELETLLVELALKNREITAREGGG
ncbi:MAG: hypothetical protein P8188_17835 [Gemmatimonadota bacterium]|jgi:hypothetical protein